jgi:hypothetical protein
MAGSGLPNGASPCFQVESSNPDWNQSAAGFSNAYRQGADALSAAWILVPIAIVASKATMALVLKTISFTVASDPTPPLWDSALEPISRAQAHFMLSETTSPGTDNAKWSNGDSTGFRLGGSQTTLLRSDGLRASSPVPSVVTKGTGLLLMVARLMYLPRPRDSWISAEFG